MSFEAFAFTLGQVVVNAGSSKAPAADNSGILIAIVGIVGTALGAIIGVAGSWAAQTSLQRKQFERDDNASRQLVRGAVLMATEVAEAAWTKGLADPERWQPVRKRLNNVVRPRILGALTTGQVDAIVYAQQTFEMVAIGLRQAFRDNVHMETQFKTVLGKPAFSTEQSCDHFHLAFVLKIMHMAEPAYKALLEACEALGSPRAEPHRLEPWQAVNYYRRLYHLPEMRDPSQSGPVA
jgi:hypothetical protein